jgi:hypothetical protein
MENALSRSIVHEAAHATVALALGVPVYRIDIWPGGGGKTFHAPTTPEHNATIAIAGAIGVALLGETAQIHYGDGNDGDYIAGLPAHRQDEVANQAAEILRENWKLWHEIANELREGTTLMNDVKDDAELTQALQQIGKALSNLPAEYRADMNLAIKRMIGAVGNHFLKAGVQAVGTKAGKANNSPPININFEAGSFELHADFPTDGLSVNVNQPARELMIERDAGGRVIGARHTDAS